MPGELLLPDIARAPRFHPVEIPTALNFHPELGYLVPSRSLRRKLCKVAAAALVGSAIAASTALALMMPRSAVEGAAHEEPLVAAAAPSVPVDQGAPAIPAPPAMHLPARAQGACDDLSTAFLAPECRSGRIGKARLAHARASRRLATVTTGAEAEPQEAAPAPGAATPAVAEAAPALPKPPPAIAAPAKPKTPAKTARKERPAQEAASADPGMPRGDPGLAFPRFVLPSLFGGADWARSW
jgi:hypothetical protein